jgi:tRNA-2-methylthio-N6-dimethylallyladenosine synthase
MGGRIDPAESGDRLRRLQALQDRHSAERLKDAVGKEFEVLVEGRSAKDPGKICGRTPCYKMVNFTAGCGTGPLRTVRIESCGVHTLSGEER